MMKFFFIRKLLASYYHGLKGFGCSLVLLKAALAPGVMQRTGLMVAIRVGFSDPCKGTDRLASVHHKITLLLQESSSPSISKKKKSFGDYDSSKKKKAMYVCMPSI